MPSSSNVSRHISWADPIATQPGTVLSQATIGPRANNEQVPQSSTAPPSTAPQATPTGLDRLRSDAREQAGLINNIQSFYRIHGLAYHNDPAQVQGEQAAIQSRAFGEDSPFLEELNDLRSARDDAARAIRGAANCQLPRQQEVMNEYLRSARMNLDFADLLAAEIRDRLDSLRVANIVQADPHSPAVRAFILRLPEAQHMLRSLGDSEDEVIESLISIDDDEVQAESPLPELVGGSDEEDGAVDEDTEALVSVDDDELQADSPLPDLVGGSDEEDGTVDEDTDAVGAVCWRCLEGYCGGRCVGDGAWSFR